jgi:hypothetical protein
MNHNLRVVRICYHRLLFGEPPCARPLTFSGSMDVIIRQSRISPGFFGCCCWGSYCYSIYSIRRVYLLLLLSHSASFILDVSSGVPIFSRENKLLDRPSGRRPDYISCSAQRTLLFLFFFFFSNRWAKMKEREGQREEKDEHPSPFAPYRSRWLGLISKNNMRTDEAPPPLAKP